MGRLASVGAVAVAVFAMGWTACSGGNSAVSTTPAPVPTIVSLSPGNQVSMDIGALQTFTATADNSSGTAITTPITFNSSNTAVVTVAANGQACAGTWDSLATPQICTPGGAGVAQITAVAGGGVTSPPTTVYVHQHIDHIELSPVSQPAPACLSRGTNELYQATAFSGNGTDITATVGKFTWTSLNTNVVVVSNSSTSLFPNQVQVTAAIPGTTSFYASVGNANSVPVTFETCRIKAIELAVNAGLGNDFTLSSNGTATVTATVTDSSNTAITGIPLTWSTSESSLVSVTGGTTAGQISGSIGAKTAGGGASITASCTPPSCNIGFQPSLPIYPETAIGVSVAPATTSTSTATTVYVASTGCGTTTNCVSKVVPIAISNNVVSDGANLPATPDSLVFSHDGTKVYMGTDQSLLGSKGLMVIDFSASTPAVSQFNSVPGKVLAVSPDGSRVVVSDILDTPNRVFIFTTASNTSISLPISGATAADFSPDSLKAYIVAGSSLYVYSTQDSLQQVLLATQNPATDVTFLQSGGFAYVAGGATTPGLTSWVTCTNASAGAPIATPGVPTFIQPLVHGGQLLAVDPPWIDTITVTSPPATTPPAEGCPPPAVTNSVSSVNLGQGNFTATQFIVAPDGLNAYVLTAERPLVLAYNIPNRSVSGIILAGNASPIRASLTPDGNLMYVAASDGLVHLVDIQSQSDILQISFPLGLCGPASGTTGTFTCNPDLIAVRP
ncbi:MAG TPA: hypothetical protein VMH85_02475 [Terriglobales bacterium]|nr:hypothetical protein [Terriglobales bacterium]